MVSVYTEVDVDLSDFDSNDLIDELESRGLLPVTGDDFAKELLESIWLKRRLGKHDYQTELDELIWTVLGKTL